MTNARRSAARIAVRIGERVWSEEVGRFDRGSQARVAAERERPRLERVGLGIDQLLGCEGEGSEGTRLAGLVKVYVPIREAPPSERPYAFVLSGGRGQRGPYLALVAFGVRHPRDGSRSAYERAHKRLHGRYPDEGSPAAYAARR